MERIAMVFTRGGLIMRRSIFSVLALLLAVLVGGAPSIHPASEPDPIKALLITGGGFHDFEAQERILTEGISERAAVEWTIDHKAGEETDVKISRHETTEWADEFDVVVYNMSFSHVTDADWIEQIAEAHREKAVPAVVLHGAVHSYRRTDTDAYRELIGVASHRHDAHRPLAVENLEPDHPVMRSFPEEWQTPNGELYDIEEVWPTVTVLARAWSEETEEHHPVIWVNELPEVPIFGTTIGHHNETMEHPVYLDMITRGLLWTLGELGDDGASVRGYESPEGP